MQHTHLVLICMTRACIYIHAYAYMDERITDACVTRATMCARVRVHVLGRTRIRAENMRALPAGGGPRAVSARRRSAVCWRSTRTSALGTPRR